MIRDPGSFRSSSTSASTEHESIMGTAILSVFAAMAAVGLQIGLDKAFQLVMGGALGALAGAAIPILIAAVFQGAISALLIQLLVGDHGIEEAPAERIRGYVVAALTGAAIAGGFAGIVEHGSPGASGGGGGSSEDNFPIIIAIAVVLVCAGIVGAIVSVLLNRGLQIIGLRVAAELTQHKSRRLVEKLAPRFLLESWWHDQKDDKKIAVLKGLATGTRWLTTCKQGDSDAVVRGVAVGMVSGMAAFHLEQTLRGPDFGFWRQVVVELLATIMGVVGASLVLGVLVSIFRYPLQLLRDIGCLALLAGALVLIAKACSG